MEIAPFTDDFLKPWDLFVEANPKSTVYHDPGWLNLLKEAFGYRQHGFLLLKEGDIIGGLFLFEVRGLGGRRLVSTPFRDRGGLLIKEGFDPDLILAEAIKRLEKSKHRYLLIKEESPLAPDLMKRWDLNVSRSHITTRLDLRVGKDALWKHLDNNAQGPVKQAEKYGLKFLQGKSINDMDIFYEIFLRTRRSLGVPSFSRAFFRSLWNNLCLKNKAVLFLAEKDGKAVAGAIHLLHKNTVIYGYAASLMKFRFLRGSDFLIWKSLEWAIDSRFSVFDFGADSISQEGLLAFKKKWGGEHVPVYFYFTPRTKEAIEDIDSGQERYDLIKKCVSKLPVPFFSILSKLTVAYFG